MKKSAKTPLIGRPAGSHLSGWDQNNSLATPFITVKMQANIPDRLNAVLVPEGIARVSYVADSKMTNTGTFTFRREDHTLGNLLRMYVSPDLPPTPHTHSGFVVVTGFFLTPSLSWTTAYIPSASPLMSSLPKPLPTHHTPTPYQGALARQRGKVCGVQAPSPSGHGHSIESAGSIWGQWDAQ